MDNSNQRKEIGYQKNDWRYNVPMSRGDPDCLDWTIYLGYPD